MKKVIIIDDEPLARSVVVEMLKSHPEFEVVSEAANGFEGIKEIESHRPELVFLDIQMPKINGFEMLELLDDIPSIIFTTAFDEYAIKAFDASAIDYLLKPFSQERFDDAVNKYSVSSEEKNQTILSGIEKVHQPEEALRIVIKDGADIKIIPTDDVNYIEAYDDYVKIHTDNKTHLKKKTMNYYESVLSNQDFARIHRSYIINVNRLTKIESFEKNSYRAILTNGARIPISRSSYSDLKKLLGV